MMTASPAPQSLVFLLFSFHFLTFADSQANLLEGLFASNPDNLKTINQLIASRGYIPEQHNVTSVDGYILNMYRLVNPFITQTRGPPFIVAPSLGLTVIYWFIGDGDMKGSANVPWDVMGNSVPLEMAKRGYDVWLLADRGTQESPLHVKYNQETDIEYWDFSIDELALYDNPAIIEYVRKVTGKPKVGYIGHSQGTIRAFMLLSARPEYNEILQPTVLFAPVTYIAHSPLPIVITAAQVIPFADQLLINRRGKVLPNINNLLQGLCFQRIVGQTSLCGLLFSAIGLIPTCSVNTSAFVALSPYFIAQLPNWSFGQLAQIAKTDEFKMLDLGPTLNQQRYGQANAPKYDLSQISNPYLMMFRALYDGVTNGPDNTRAEREIESRGNKIYYKTVIDPPFCHIDFGMGTNCGEKVIQPLLQLLKRFD